jgi:hypothetical protein
MSAAPTRVPARATSPPNALLRATECIIPVAAADEAAADDATDVEDELDEPDVEDVWDAEEDVAVSDAGDVPVTEVVALVEFEETVLHQPNAQFRGGMKKKITYPTHTLLPESLRLTSPPLRCN